MDKSPPTSSVLNKESNDSKYKLIDYLIKRLEHTITHTQTATKLIYLVNGAILAAVYFGFGKIRPISDAFLIAGVLSLLLFIINFLHANFMAIQNAWYSTIDREIRNVFLSYDGIENLWPKHLGQSLDEVIKKYKDWFFPFRRTHRIYVWIHLIVAIFLLLFSISFFYKAYHKPNGTAVIQSLPLQLGDDFSKAEEIIGDLKPWAEQKDVLWNQRYGIFIALTSTKKIKRISVNRSRGEFDLSSSLYGIKPSDTLESLKVKFGNYIKEDDRGELVDYVFKTGKIFIEVTFIDRNSSKSGEVNLEDLDWYSISRAL